MSKKTESHTTTQTKPRRAYKRRKPAVPPELSAKRRAAALAQWEGKERTPYKNTRLQARAINMLREHAARLGVSASQALIDALEACDCTLSKIR